MNHSVDGNPKATEAWYAQRALLNTLEGMFDADMENHEVRDDFRRRFTFGFRVGEPVTAHDPVTGEEVKVEPHFDDALFERFVLARKRQRERREVERDNEVLQLVERRIARKFVESLIGQHFPGASEDDTNYITDVIMAQCRAGDDYTDCDRCAAAFLEKGLGYIRNRRRKDAWIQNFLRARIVFLASCRTAFRIAITLGIFRVVTSPFEAIVAAILIQIWVAIAIEGVLAARRSLYRDTQFWAVRELLGGKTQYLEEEAVRKPFSLWMDFGRDHRFKRPMSPHIQPDGSVDVANWIDMLGLWGMELIALWEIVRALGWL